MLSQGNSAEAYELNCVGYKERAVECARRRGDADPALRAHLRVCEACRERWEAELELSAHLGFLSAESRPRRSSGDARESLMNIFEARHARRSSPRWYWAAAVAAAVLLGLVLGPEAVNRLRHPAASAPDETAASTIESYADSEGFIAVPYAPPLATGEMVRIVHTELNPAALASLGVSVDPAWTTQLPADVLEGEDGMPRAVRVSDSEYNESGS
jgi:hypothetical protein